MEKQFEKYKGIHPGIIPERELKNDQSSSVLLPYLLQNIPRALMLLLKEDAA